MSENISEERLILDKATNKIPPLKEWLGLTITFKDAIERHTYREQYNKTAYSICRIMNDGATAYRLYPEFTETGRIHYHGIYKPDTKYKALKMYERLRKNGFIKIERKISTKWHEYIVKDYKDTCKLIGLKSTLISPDMHERILAVDSSRRQIMEHFVTEHKNYDLI